MTRKLFATALPPSLWLALAIICGGSAVAMGGVVILALMVR